MSTLFTQPPRDYKRATSVDVDDFLAIAKELALKHKIEVSDVVAAKHALELQRRNDLQVANGDAYDEQLAGFGEILNNIADSLRDMADAQGE
jgi:hypothetical protein